MILQHPEAFTGKIVDSTKWIIPDGYATCAVTGKFYPFDQLSITFAHWVFSRDFRIQHDLNCEDADWLSEEGYYILMSKLQQLGLEEDYHEAVWNDMTIEAYQQRKNDMHAQYTGAAEVAPPELDEPIEYITLNDFVEVNLRGSVAPFYGTVIDVEVDTQWAKVEEERFGALRWVFIDDMRLVLKNSALS